jgi:hypothetical protein
MCFRKVKKHLRFVIKVGGRDYTYPNLKEKANIKAATLAAAIDGDDGQLGTYRTAAFELRHNHGGSASVIPNGIAFFADSGAPLFDDMRALEERCRAHLAKNGHSAEHGFLVAHLSEDLLKSIAASPPVRIYAEGHEKLGEKVLISGRGWTGRQTLTSQADGDDGDGSGGGEGDDGDDGDDGRGGSSSSSSSSSSGEKPVKKAHKTPAAGVPHGTKESGTGGSISPSPIKPMELECAVAGSASGDSLKGGHKGKRLQLKGAHEEAQPPKPKKSKRADRINTKQGGQSGGADAVTGGVAGGRSSPSSEQSNGSKRQKREAGKVLTTAAMQEALQRKDDDHAASLEAAGEAAAATLKKAGLRHVQLAKEEKKKAQNEVEKAEGWLGLVRAELDKAKKQVAALTVAASAVRAGAACQCGGGGCDSCGGGPQPPPAPVVALPRRLADPMSSAQAFATPAVRRPPRTRPAPGSPPPPRLAHPVSSPFSIFPSRPFDTPLQRQLTHQRWLEFKRGQQPLLAQHRQQQQQQQHQQRQQQLN